MNLRTAFAAVLLASVAVVSAPSANAAPVASQSAPHAQYDATRVACRYSDGPGPCFFDAGERGNHRGASYWIGRNGVAHYVDGVHYRLQSYAGQSTEPAQYDPTRVACDSEDGGSTLPCFWDAAKRGNHHGASYWIGRNGWVHYVDGTTFHLQGVGRQAK